VGGGRIVTQVLIVFVVLFFPSFWVKSFKKTVELKSFSNPRTRMKLLRMKKKADFFSAKAV
jgi:hypothetical protein